MTSAIQLDRRNLVFGAAAAAVVLSPVAGIVGAQAYDNPDDMYAALREQPAMVLRAREGIVRLVFADGAPGVDRNRVVTWVKRAISAVETYFGRFPVAQLGLLVIAEASDQVGHATTFGYAGSATRIRVGTDADDDAFARDWVLVHEMVHTALPDLPRRALWLQEGSATYVEPIARAMAGQLPATEVWRQSIVGMPKGEPGAADGGMDGTQAWGRLYWGGATFWLSSEIAILQASKGARSLRDAMRRINRESGGNSVDWTPERMMAAGDAATGGTVLSRLYERFATTRVATDLPALFASIGVGVDAHGAVRFDDRAPLAALRERITAG